MRFAQRWAHDVLGALKVALKIARIIQQQILRTGLNVHLHLAACLGRTNRFKSKRTGQMHDVDTGIGKLRKIAQTRNSLCLTGSRTAHGMAFGAGNACRYHAPLHLVDKSTVFAMDAQNTVNIADTLKHLKRLGVIQAQMIVGKVCLERHNSGITHNLHISLGLIVPIGNGHVERIVGGAGTVGAPVPLIKRFSQRHALVLRGVVHNRGGSSTGSGTRSCLKAVSRPIHTRPALHVRMGIDETREYVFAGGIDNTVICARLVRTSHLDDLLAIQHQIARKDAFRQHKKAVLYYVHQSTPNLSVVKPLIDTDVFVASARRSSSAGVSTSISSSTHVASTSTADA